jgi:hypothetical protein
MAGYDGRQIAGTTEKPPLHFCSFCEKCRGFFAVFELAFCAPKAYNAFVAWGNFFLFCPCFKN